MSLLNERREYEVIDLDPELVLKSPWLWDAKTIAWAEATVAARTAPVSSGSQS